MLRPNKALHIEQEVLQRYFMKRMEITPELSTGFLNDVLAQDGSCLQKISSLLQEEENLEFADIEEKFKVIEENTVLAVVDEALAKGSFLERPIGQSCKRTRYLSASRTYGRGTSKRSAMAFISGRCGMIRFWAICAAFWIWKEQNMAF